MTPMRQVRLSDGTRVYCLRRMEALVLDSHVSGYLRHGIELGPAPVVIDAGANIGLFALRVLERCGGDATVLAFEPVPPIIAVLERNALRHDPARFRVFGYGLSSQPGVAQMTYFPRAPAIATAHPEIYDEDAALLPNSVLGTARSAPAGLRWARLLPAALCRLIAGRLRGGARRFRCELRTLSQVIHEHGLARIDLLKVDVEGEELEVLRGVDAADWPRIRQVVVEVHDRAGRLEGVRTLLHQHGLCHQTVDQEDGFRHLPFYNIYARR